MRILRPGILGCLLALIAHGGLPVAVIGAERPEEETARIVMQSRQFSPERTVLHRGHSTRLLFQNQDTELHSFVPFGLFRGVSFNVSGNGAPEFGPEGLTRVVIPADGLAEIRFTPTTPGTYRYICDMPGHQMHAVIVVE
jgi:plastocyanin